MIDKSGRYLSLEARKAMGGNTRFKPTHGRKGTPEYSVWIDMKNRCRNKNVRSYANYGGRGIKVCPEWELSFEAFLQYVGLRPDGYSLDRINTNGHYEPGNVRWVPAKEQQLNKRNTVYVIFRGNKTPMVQYARDTGQKPETVRKRIKRGLPIFEAIPCK